MTEARVGSVGRGDEHGVIHFLDARLTSNTAESSLVG